MRNEKTKQQQKIRVIHRSRGTSKREDQERFARVETGNLEWREAKECARKEFERRRSGEREKERRKGEGERLSLQRRNFIRVVESSLRLICLRVQSVR